jgi:hypothetical protein
MTTTTGSMRTTGHVWYEFAAGDVKDGEELTGARPQPTLSGGRDPAKTAIQPWPLRHGFGCV